MNAMSMINRKLDVINVIEVMNELEKLKIILFDKNQYYIFEHIPKPILFDKKLIELNNKDINELENKLTNTEIRKFRNQGILRDETGDAQNLSMTPQHGRLLDTKKEVLTCHARFWQKKTDIEKEYNFRQALEKIKYKENPDYIDQRLIDLLLADFEDHEDQEDQLGQSKLHG